MKTERKNTQHTARQNKRAQERTQTKLKETDKHT